MKGAYNGVYKDRSLQRLASRGIPSSLVIWVGAFCSGRTATIVVNVQASEVREPKQAGLPQSSHSSPVLLMWILFSNVWTTMVVQSLLLMTTRHGLWARNMYGLDAVVQRGTSWESTIGASFEGDKTAFIHFMTNKCQFAHEPISVQGEEVLPMPSVKILGLTMDSGSCYQEHSARAATKGCKRPWR